MDGQGVLTGPDGGRYDGQWRAGLPHGFGAFTRPPATLRRGLWREGCFREGKMEFAIGRRLDSCRTEAPAVPVSPR
jgi:hypothetical protein